MPGVVKTADKKPEMYTDETGRRRMRMVPTNLNVVNTDATTDKKSTKESTLSKLADLMKRANEQVEEKTLTSAEKKKREEIAKAMEKENPGMDMGKKMAIATAIAKRAVEEVELDEAPKKTYRDYKFEYEKLTGKKAPAGTSTQAMMRILDKAKMSMKKEEVELDEAETKFVIKHKKTKKVLSTHDNYNDAKDEHNGISDKNNYMLVKQTKKDAALANRNTMREEVELDEAVKIGSKVKIHAPGKDYHDQVGHVGEIRHGAFKGAAKTYTVDYGDRKSVQLQKNQIKLHKEAVELDEDITKMSHSRLKFHVDNKFPHGSYTQNQMKAERDRRLKTGQGGAYKAAKPSLSEAVELDEYSYGVEENVQINHTSFKSFYNNLIEANNKYTATSEKSKFHKDGYRPLLKDPNGKISYLASVAYKTHKHAKGEAQAYHDAYFGGPVRANERGADRAVQAYRAKHKEHMAESVDQIDEISNDKMMKYYYKNYDDRAEIQSKKNPTDAEEARLARRKQFASKVALKMYPDSNKKKATPKSSALAAFMADRKAAKE